MGNCGLKPKVLSETGAPAPENLEISLLEDQKIDAAKSLINLFLQDKADKTIKEDENTIPGTEDLKTSLAEAKAPVVTNEEAVHDEKVMDDATVKETETEEVRGDAQTQ